MYFAVDHFKLYQHYKNIMQLDEDESMILLDGPPCSGKSTLAKLFEPLGYVYIGIDDFNRKGQYSTYTQIKNEYMDIRDEMRNETAKLMAYESKKHNKFIFDTTNQKINQFFDMDKLFIVIVYAPLNELIRNMKSRQLTDPRGLFVFNRYSQKYKKTDDVSESIDIINRQKFVEMLETMKYEFKSENDLLLFANKIFKEMGIEDDNDHHIRLRGGCEYNYILNTTNKTIEELFMELKSII